MPQTTYDQIEQSLRSGKIAGVYLFDGPENWLKERMVEMLIAKLVTPDSRDFNFDRFDGRSLSPSEVISSAMSFPFLGERRLIIVKAADELAASDARLIGESIPQFPPSSCVVFLYDGKSNLKEEIPAQVSQHGVTATFWTPFANQLPAWIMKESKLRGKGITPEAAQELAGAGDDLQTLSNELDKMILYVGSKKTIEMSDLEKYGAFDESADMRKLETALWFRDMLQALTQCHLMSESGIRSEALIPVFQRVFRQLTLGHYLSGVERCSPADVAASLRLRGITQQRQYQAGQRAYSAQDASAAFEKIVNADEDVKTGVLSSDVALSLLVVKFVG